MVTLLEHERELRRMTVRQAEEEANRLLESSWWPSRDLPVDPFHLARGLGILVRIEPLRADESGNITISPSQTPVMTLNRYDGESRQRFTCAHEIGHYLRRSQVPSAQQFTDYRDTLAGMGSDPEEIFANQFAAALLMPASKVLEFSNAGIQVEDMARRFSTSTQAMELRLRNLRLT